MRGVSLFAGAGGLDLGLELAGHEILVAVENEPAAARVFRERFPEVELVEGDVSAVEWERYLDRGFDFLVAGFPCPDFSVAGSRKGMSGDRGALWHEVVRALRVLRPRFVVLENVDAIRTAPGMAEHPGESALGVVVADLASLLYVGTGIRLGAADVGAPHLRYRAFFVAALADPERGGIDADSGTRRGDAGGGDRPGGASLPSGSEVALAEDALADRPGAPPDSDRGGRIGGEDVEGVGPAGRGGPRGDGEEAPPDAGQLGLSRGVGGGEAGRRRSRGSADGREAPPDPERVGRSRRGGSDEGGPTGDGEHGRADPEGSRPLPPDPRREPREPRSGRRTPSRDSPRRDEEEPDAGDRLPRTPEPRTDAGGAEAVPDPDGVGPRGSLGGLEGGGRRGRASGDLEAAPDADERGREGLGVEEPQGVEGERGSLVDGRDPVRELDDAAATDWGAFAEAVERWEYLLGRRAPRPTDDRGRLMPEFVEWMMGFPEGWTDVEGVPRTKRLMMLGNAVQVQCAVLVGEWLSDVALTHRGPPNGRPRT